MELNKYFLLFILISIGLCAEQQYNPSLSIVALAPSGASKKAEIISPLDISIMLIAFGDITFLRGICFFYT